MKQDLIGKNKIFKFILGKQILLLVMLFIVIVLIPLISNILHNKPLLMGAESYYHLTHAPFSRILTAIPESTILLVPLVMGLSSVLLLFHVVRRFNLPSHYSFFFLFFLMLTPAFMYSFSTISGYGLFFFLVLIGFTFLVLPGKMPFLSIIPFVLATTIDSISGILLVLLQLLYVYNKERKFFIIVAITIVTGILSFLFLKVPFVLGPFHVEHRMLDLISDLGSFSGIGFIIILLTFIGVGVVWRKKEFRIMYPLLFGTIIIYLYSTETILFLAATMAFLATCGFVALFEKAWNLPLLKRFTFLLIMLSIVFSLLTYLNRVPETSPTLSEKETLQWVQANTPEDAVIFSAVENGYFVLYFTQRQPFQQFHDRELQEHVAGTITNSTYIATTFPLLDQEKITHIYVTPLMKKQLPAEQGILFLLSNERFKLVYSSQGYEVWEFKSSGETS